MANLWVLVLQFWAPNGESFWPGKGWGFFGIRNSQVVKWCRNHGRNDAVCQALWYGVRFLRQFTWGHCHTGKVFGWLYVLIASSCLHGNLQVSTNLPHGYQQLMLKTNLRTLQSERHPPRHGGSVCSQTAGQICSKICFQSIFQARIAEVFGIIIHSMGLGLRLQCSAGEICTTTLARSWSIWSQITLLCCESQGVSGRSASWMKKNVDSLYCAYVNSWWVRDNHIDPYHWVITACP